MSGLDYEALAMAERSGQITAGDILSRLSGAETKEYWAARTKVFRGAERERPDNSVLGMPPELAVTAPVGVARAVVGAAPGVMSRGIAGATAAVAQAAPQLKYEATKTVLERMGVPSPLAAAAAFAVSSGTPNRIRPSARPAAPSAAPPAPNRPASATGTQWGHVPPETVAARPAPTPAAAPPATVSAPVASVPPPAAPAPPAAPSARTAAAGSTAGSRPSPQRIRNEVGLAHRQSGLKLTETQLAEADALVAQGISPDAAVRQVGGVAAPPAASAAPAPTAKPPRSPAVPKGLKLSPEESKLYVRLRKEGTSHPEAVQAIEAMRSIAQRFATPNTETVIQKVVDRNVTGRWREPK